MSQENHLITTEIKNIEEPQEGITKVKPKRVRRRKYTVEEAIQRNRERANFNSKKRYQEYKKNKQLIEQLKKELNEINLKE